MGLALFVAVFQNSEYQQRQEGAEGDGYPDTVADVKDTGQRDFTEVGEVDQGGH